MEFRRLQRRAGGEGFQFSRVAVSGERRTAPEQQGASQWKDDHHCAEPRGGGRAAGGSAHNHLWSAGAMGGEFISSRTRDRLWWRRKEMVAAGESPRRGPRGDRKDGLSAREKPRL